MGPGWDGTRDPWICSQTRICCQIRYRLRYTVCTLVVIIQDQSELPQSIPWIYFDNVILMLHNVTLTSQKPCQHNNKCDCSKTNGYKLTALKSLALSLSNTSAKFLIDQNRF